MCRHSCEDEVIKEKALYAHSTGIGAVRGHTAATQQGRSAKAMEVATKLSAMQAAKVGRSSLGECKQLKAAQAVRVCTSSYVENKQRRGVQAAENGTSSKSAHQQLRGKQAA